MDIKETQSRMLKVADLRPNEGQIPNVPANPRYISEREYDELKASIEADNLTGVLQMKVYQYEGTWVVLDGNMRLKALQDLGIDEVQCLLVPDDTDAKTLRKIVVSANSTFGQWDMDMLANEWDADEVQAWGVLIPSLIEELPDELAGADLTPDELLEIEGDNATEMERVIIVYHKEMADELAHTIGLEKIDKVVYKLDELAPRE